jgi:hypothetical protein
MLAGKSFLSFSKSPIRGVAQLSIWSAFRVVSGPGSKPLIFLVPGLRMCGSVSAIPPLSATPSLCGA